MNHHKINRPAIKIAISFAIIGVLWIIFSDKLVAFYFDDLSTLDQVQTFKGWFFVIATSVLIYFLIRNRLNIIQRKNIELSKSMFRYRSTLDNMLEGAQIIDRNWTYVYVNDVVAQQGKKTKSELLGKTMMEAYPGIEKTELFGVVKKCMGERTHRLMENKFIFPNGSVGYFELSIQPVPEGLFILSYDITERVQAEKELKIGEDRLIEAQRIAKMGDFTWDVESGEVTWSDPLHELLGYDKDEKINYEKINNYIHHPDDLTDVLGWLNKNIESGSDVLTPKEYRLLKKNGEVIYVLTQGKILTAKGNKKVFATVQDITHKKQAELALRENEERYRNLFMHSPDALFVNKQDKIIMANDAFVALMGAKKKDELIGKSPYDIFHPSMHEKLKERIYKVRELGEKPPHYEEKVVKLNGKVVDVEVQRATFTLGRETAIHVILRDITEKKKTQKELDKSRRTLETLMGNLPGMAYHSLNKPNWPMEFASDGCIELTGYSSKELTTKSGSDYGDLIHPEDKQYVWETVQDAVNNKSPFITEYRIKTKDGKEKWVWEQGLSVAINMDQINIIEGFITDITARKKAEQELKKHRQHLEQLVKERSEELYRSEKKYRGLYESVKDGILHADIDGNIIECNPEFANMLGYEIDELKEKSLYEITPDYLKNGIDRVVNEQIMEKGYTEEYEKEYIRKDGSTVPVSIRGWLVKGKDNESIGMWGIIRDITKRKEYEKSIQQLNTHLQERQKELEMANEELEAFAYSVSHDLRAPLRAIDGYTNILMEEYIDDLDDEAHRLGKVVQDNSKKMGQLIDDLLAFSRMGRTSMNPSIIDMKNMANSIYHEASTEEQRDKIDLQLADLPKTRGDTSMMRHVWMNLISNAIKYSSHQEKIKIIISYENKEDRIIYSIQDNGVGFNMKHIDKLFGVFQRLHSNKEFEGTGVGLAIVHRIITRHKGNIWAKAEPDKGATFYFSLPKG